MRATAERRKNTFRIIRKKKRISSVYFKYPWDETHTYSSNNHTGYYKYDGQYSNGMVWRSCPQYARKTRNRKRYGKVTMFKPSDIRKIEAMNFQIRDYHGNVRKEVV